MVKEGYKETELGVIPEDWEIMYFGDCFDILPNNTFSRAELNQNYGEIKNIHYGDILVEFSAIIDNRKVPLPFINANNKSKVCKRFLCDGDIIIADTAEDMTVGKATEIIGVNKDKIVAGLHTIPCRPKSNEMFALKWLGYYINHSIYHDQLIPYITGTKVSSISKGAITNTLVLIPPKDEQQKIVEALFDMDNLISSLEKLIEKKKAIKQACLQKMFPKEGETTPEMRLPCFTEPWERRKLGEIFTFKYGDGNNNPSNGGKYPVYGAGGIQGGYTKYNAENSVIIGHMGDAGCVSWGEGKHFVTYNGTITKPKDDFFSSKFGYYLLLHMNLRKYRGGSGLPFLTYDMLTEMETMCPRNKAEAETISAMFSYLDNLIVLHQRKLEKYKKIKQGMMQQLLTGKIRLV